MFIISYPGFAARDLSSFFDPGMFIYTLHPPSPRGNVAKIRKCIVYDVVHRMDTKSPHGNVLNTCF